MKKLSICITVFCLLFTGSLFAQQQHMKPGAEGRRMNMEEHRENIESMKIAFLTRKLSLTPEEAQKFWPVYNNYTDEIRKLRGDRRDQMRDAREDFDKLNDKDVEKLIDSEMTFKQQELDVMKKYHSQFKGVLPMKKVALLYRAEEDFKRELIEKIKERRGEGGKEGHQ